MNWISSENIPFYCSVGIIFHAPINFCTNKKTQPTVHTTQGLAIKKSRGSGKSDWKPVNTKTLVIVDY